MDNAYDMGRKRGQEESRKEIERLRKAGGDLKEINDSLTIVLERIENHSVAQGKEIECLKKEKEWLLRKLVDETKDCGRYSMSEDILKEMQQALKEG